MNATFRATREWHTVPPGAVLPGGCEIRMDFDTGQTEARLATNGSALDGLDEAYVADAEEGTSKAETKPEGARPFNLLAHGAERFVGTPPPIEWLVEGSIPLGVPTLIAAMGEIGKSFSALNLCRLVSTPAVGNLSFNLRVFGGQVAAHGAAVFLTAEDSENSLWRRVQALDPLDKRLLNPRRLIVKSVCGEYPRRVFFMQDNRLGLWATEDWAQFCQECRAIKDLKLIVIGPLQMFAQVALDVDNAAAQFVCAQLAWLAEQSGATVIRLPPHEQGQRRGSCQRRRSPAPCPGLQRARRRRPLRLRAVGSRGSRGQ